VQREAAPEEEEPVQGSFAPGGPAVQRDEVPDEEPAE
jgi:hypothetical protein